MQAYLISINEQQRQLITAACAKLLENPDNFETLAGELDPTDSADPSDLDILGPQDAISETDTLLEMFKELPEMEKKSPRVIHGFCL